MKTIQLNFGGGWIDYSPYLRDDLILQERLCTDDFHNAQNVLSFSFNENIPLYQNMIVVAKKVEVRVKEDAATWFLGIMPYTFKFESDGTLLKESQFEAIDLSEKLRKKITTEFMYSDYKILDHVDIDHSICHQILYLCGFAAEDLDPTVSISGIVPYVSANSGTYFDFLNVLLHEYGYVFRFKSNGLFSPWQWIRTSIIKDYDADENVIIEPLKIGKTEKDYEAVEITWFELVERPDTLIFMADLPFGSDNQRIGYPIQDGFYYPAEANIPTLWENTFQKYTEDGIFIVLGNKVEKNKDFSKIVRTQNHELVHSFDVGITCESEFFNTQAHVRYYVQNVEHPGSSLRLYYMDIFADVLYKTSERLAKKENVEDTLLILDYESQFIFNSGIAENLAAGRATMLSGSNFNYEFESQSDYPIGSIVQIIEPITGIIQLCYVFDRKEIIMDNVLSFQLRGISAVTTSGIIGSVRIYPANTNQDIYDRLAQGTVTIGESTGAEVGDHAAPVLGTILSTIANSDGIVTITWSDFIDAKSGTAGYRIWRQLIPSGIQQIIGEAVENNFFVDFLGIQNESYLYGVSAYDRMGNESSIIWTISGITINDIVPPGDVLDLTAANYGVQGVYIVWDQVDDYDVAAYELRIGSNWNVGTSLFIGRSNTYWWNIQVSGTYHLMVKAIDDAGNYSINEKAVNITIGNTLIPAVPVITVIPYFKALNIISDKQLSLVGQYCYYIQCSKDQVNWYQPQTDGTDWKQGSIDGYGIFYSDSFFHNNIPFEGTITLPSPTVVYYRLKRVVINTGVGSDWSSIINGTTALVTTGDIVASSIVAEKLNVISLSAITADMGTIIAGVIIRDEHNEWSEDIFRIGTEDEYVMYLPAGQISDGKTGPGVFLKSSKIEITSVGFGVLGELYVSERAGIGTDPNSSFALTINGMQYNDGNLYLGGTAVFPSGIDAQGPPGPIGPSGIQGIPGIILPDITDLPEASALTGSEVTIIMQSGIAVQETLTNIVALAATSLLPMNCLEGCAAINDASVPDFNITITKGRRRDSTNAVNIVNAAADLTKQMNYKWAAGGTDAAPKGGADLGMTVSKVSVSDVTDLATITTAAAHGITTLSTVLIANLATSHALVNTHLNAKAVATVTGATTFTIPLAGHTLAEETPTEGVVIACSVGAVATSPGCTYYEYLGLNGATVDAFFSISAIGATPPTGYTYFRQLLAFRTDADGHILPGTWSEGNQRFRFSTPRLGRTYATWGTTNRITNINSGAISNSRALLNFIYASDAAVRQFQFNAVADAEVAPTNENNSEVVVSANQFGQLIKPIWTDANGYIATQSSGANCAFSVVCVEYWLPLGAYDYV